MNRRTASILILLLAGLVSPLLAQQGAEHKLDASINLNNYALQGGGSIILKSLPAGNVLKLAALAEDSIPLELTSVFVNGAELAVSRIGDEFHIDLSQQVAPLTLELNWRLVGLSDYEGIVLLNDYDDGSGARAWYPRVLNLPVERIELSLMIQGEALVAANAEVVSGENIGGMMEYSLSSSNSMLLYISPIFVEKRTNANNTSLGVFMRQGADAWKNRLLGNASEINDFYSAAIPGYSPDRLDLVVAGQEHPAANIVPGIMIIKDVIDSYVSDLGAVFTGHFLRWQISVKMAGAWFASQLSVPEQTIPWLVDGLAYYYAYEYAQAVLLGGPAFDNVKQLYLNAAGGTANLSLSQERQAVDENLEILSQSKGFWIVGMLRQEMGKRAFESWVDSLETFKGELDNQTVQDLAEAASGKNLASFFETWVYNDTRLDLAIEEARLTAAGIDLELQNTATIPVVVDVALSLETGQTVIKEITLAPGASRVQLEADSPIRRIRLDAARVYPDVDRGNNVRSFGNTEAIEQLYAIDNSFTISDFELVSDPVQAGRQRVSDFQLSIINRQSRDAYLGLRLTTGFPGGRNRGISKILVQLAPEETQTLHDLLFIPALGSGPMSVKVEYFVVSSREEFEKLNRRSKPNMTSWYVVPVNAQ